MDADIRELFVEDEVFDPFDEEEQEGDGAPEEPLVGAPLERSEEAAADDRPAQERFAELANSMPGQKRTLFRLVDYCREPKSGLEMDAETERLLEFNFSVYSPVVFRELLERAGAIRYLPAESEVAGEAAGEAAEEAAAKAADEPEVVSERYFDGEEEVDIEFLEVSEERPGLWEATPEGLDVVDAQDDEGEIRELLGKEPVYVDIYQQILDFCCEEGGRSAKEVDRLVNDSPLLQEPRRYSGYFVGRLERKGALSWRGGWCTTDAGKALMEASAPRARISYESRMK